MHFTLHIKIKKVKENVFSDLGDITINTNLVHSNSGATLKFELFVLKNTTHSNFQVKISTPGILAAIRSSVKRL